MTTQQFSDFVTSSIQSNNGQQGIAGPPAFVNSVMVAGLYGSINFINPLYCASPQCASYLVSLLNDLSPTVVNLPPYDLGPSSLFGFNAVVPWLKFPNGPTLNVAQLASCFSHGYNPNTMLALVKWQITSAAFAGGFTSVDPGPFVG
jgi:hypothetical protein